MVLVKPMRDHIEIEVIQFSLLDNFQFDILGDFTQNPQEILHLLEQVLFAGELVPLLELRL